MAKYIFWQKKTVRAKNLNEAIRIQDKFKYEFDSLTEEEDKSNNELTSCIGFQTDTESDYEEYDKSKKKGCK